MTKLWNGCILLSVLVVLTGCVSGPEMPILQEKLPSQQPSEQEVAASGDQVEQPTQTGDSHTNPADDRTISGTGLSQQVGSTARDESPIGTDQSSTHPILTRLNIPEGFAMAVYAEIPNARSLELVERDNERVLFVGNRQGDSVYAVIDRQGDFIVDETKELITDLTMPNGVAFQEGDLYVAELNRVLRFPNILDQLDDPIYQVVYDELPDDRSHGWKYIAFGPDGNLYIPIGAPCNICDAGLPYAALHKLDLETNELSLVAQGIRNTVGFDRHPTTDQLRFTDNGRDWFGNDIPPDELNRLDQIGQHFGYPYCHGGDLQDDTFTEMSCDAFEAPVVKLGPHVAALGMEFYDGAQFPAVYHEQIFIAEHGSRNRTPPIGYRITLVDPEEESYEPFIDGRLQPGGDVLGRPVDIEIASDGSLLISDDQADLIYRVRRAGSD